MEEVLPDDMLADVLGRLPPSSLAASRCVRKRWCSIIDARRLLRADLLPLRLQGFYCISLDLIERRTYFFARPPAAHRIPGGTLDFLERHSSLQVEDHCNGLLLVSDMEHMVVVNPATRQWATLPTFPKPSIDDMLGVAVTMDQQNNDVLSSRFYIVYDPMVDSPQNFQVFLIPLLSHNSLGNRENIVTIDLEEQEWPPSTFRTHVFSLRTWRWEERSLVRQGEPAGTMADMLQCDCFNRKAVYFRGALYVHCQNDSVMRIALSNDKYQMVRSPVTLSKLDADYATFYLGKSEKGVYFALLYWVDFDSYPQFQVWLLTEEEEYDEGHHHIHMEWVLKTNISLQPLLAKSPLIHNDFADDQRRVIHNYNEELEAHPATADDDNKFADDDEWDFDKANEIVMLQANKDNKAEADCSYHVDFLGFHPYKEIVFFSLLSSRTISYNLNTSKVQQLGGSIHVPVGMKTCFPYTPCWLTMWELFENS